MLNRKKIWAVFFVCFSLPRNAIILFYDTEKNYKVGFMRILKFLGFIWISFDTTFYVALRTYPVNYVDYPSLTTKPFATILMSGVIFGLSMVYFYSGFAAMYDVLLSIYVRQQKFNPLLFIFRCFIFYVIPVAFTTAIMVAVFPYIGEGPLYSLITKDMFLDNCV